MIILEADLKSLQISKDVEDSVCESNRRLADIKVNITDTALLTNKLKEIVVNIYNEVEKFKI